MANISLDEAMRQLEVAKANIELQWKDRTKLLLDEMKKKIDQRLAGIVVGGKVMGSKIGGTIPITSLPAHAATHESGGSDQLPVDSLNPQVTDRFQPQASADPTAPTDGQVWYRTDTHSPKLRKSGSTVIFETQDNKGAASGYAPLDSGVLVPTSYLGSGSPNSANLLRGDRSWSNTLTGQFSAQTFKPTGATGATASGSWQGSTANGAPTAGGPFAVGDWVTDQVGKRWTCILAGSPGTWIQEPGTGGSGSGGGIENALSVQVLSTTQATINFPNISQSYRNIKIKLIARCDQATGQRILVRVNSDSGSNYDWQLVQGIGTGVGATQSIADTSWIASFAPNTGVTAGAATTVEIDLPYYSQTAFWKNYISHAFYPQAVSASNLIAYYIEGEWRSTAPITNVSIFLAAGNFVAGTVAILYGEADSPVVGSGSGHVHVWAEDQSVNCNGSTVTFTLANAYSAGTTEVFLNGVRQRVGASYDYAETNPITGSITFNVAPPAGSILLVNYVKAGATLSNTVWNSAWASPPASPISGDLWYPPDAPYGGRYNGSSWDWRYQNQPVSVPPSTGWTMISSQTPSSLDFSHGALSIAGAGVYTGNAWIVRPAIATPYTVTAWLIPSVLQAATANHHVGLVIYDSISARLITWVIISAQNQAYSQLQVDYWGAGFAFSSAPYIQQVNWNGPLWMRFKDDGTNLTFSWSRDGYYFIQAYQASRTAWLVNGPNNAGVFVNSDDTKQSQLLVPSWTMA